MKKLKKETREKANKNFTLLEGCREKKRLALARRSRVKKKTKKK